MMNGCWILRRFFMRHSVSTLVATSYQKELTRFVAQEDCTARSLVKGETQDESDNVKEKESCEEVEKDDEDKDEDSDDNEVERGSSTSTAKSANKGLSEYAQRREKNIAELKKILEEVKAKNPMPELPKAKSRVKKGCVYNACHVSV